MKELYVLLLTGIIALNSSGTPLPVRTEISLNGTWDFTPEGEEKTKISVPDYWDAIPGFDSVKRAVYERRVTLPDTEEWRNKQIKLEFEGVNFIAEVYINKKKVASHIGGWIPFSVDITDLVKPGKEFTVKVDVKGGSYPPIVNENGALQWPVGFFGQKFRWGIVFDVWLRAYGKVCIEDAFIQTFYREKKIRVEYTLKNNYKEEKSVVIHGEVAPEIDLNNAEKNFKSEVLALNAEETRKVIVERQWLNPHLWTPDDPFLYYLSSAITESGNSTEIIDREIRRFGFREVWAQGNKLMFNGHRFNILGTNIVQHSEYYKDQRYYYLSRESWNSSIDRLFELNLRTVRFHMQPAPKYILDIADERGMMVIDESTIYARRYINKANKEAYMENCRKWIGPWIKARRNHPSIIIWSAENEMGRGWIRWMTDEEIKSLGDEIRLFDTTRFVNYDGDKDVGDRLINLHYPESYAKTVDSSIYSWDTLVSPDKPTGVGEFLTHYREEGEKNQWWQGTWVRGMRYVNFADIRPYRHDWAWLRSDNTPKINNLKNGFAPVALFDKEYDDLGLKPLLYKNYPVVKPGDEVNRTLVLYNDEFSDTIITVEVLVKSSEIHQALYNYNGNKTPKQKIVAQGYHTYFVPFGEHIDIPYSFQVPTMKEGFIDHIDVELITRKKGEVKFRETLRFAMRGFGFVGESSKKVILGEAVK
jgi:beta-galactosidase/beta-glucuronidase